MILKKEFYFVRHGQTDHNKANLNSSQDENMPLNNIGRGQAYALKSVVSELQIKTICSSPLRRAQETANILSLSLHSDFQTIDDLTECSIQIWNEIICFKNFSSLPLKRNINSFIEKVKRGVNQALAFSDPILIVAHGGIHWVLCCLLSIDQHEWIIDNCLPVRFSLNRNGKWLVGKL